MKIAVNQLNPVSNKPEINFDTIHKTIIKNKKDGAVLSIFPEDFLYGIVRDKSDQIEAGKQHEAWIKKFQELAIKHHIDIIPGSFPRYENGNSYNSTVYIDANGYIKTRYSKSNLWLSERIDYTPDLNMPEVFDSVLGKTAIIICWDILDHRLMRGAVKNGAEWIICIAFWTNSQDKDLSETRGNVIRGEWKHPDSLLLSNMIKTRSFEYGVGFIFANFAGIHYHSNDEGIIRRADSAGRTQVVTPGHQQQYVFNHRRSETLISDIDTKKFKNELNNAEILYGRNGDISNEYPYGGPM